MLRDSGAIVRHAIAVAFVSCIAAHSHAANAPASKPTAPKRPPTQALAGASATAMPVENAAFVSRELVDVQFQPDRSLAILVSTPGTATPGLYLWEAHEPQPRRLCAINAPSFFSFDRKVVIEREHGAFSRVRLYAAADCGALATIDIAGRVLDVDVRDRYIAAAVRLAEKQVALQLYGFDGQLIASTNIGRNVEMGFAPDGAMLVNFDLSDVGLQAWQMPRLTNFSLPQWLRDANVTFVPGSRFVKRYENETLSIAQWPLGTPVHAMPASRSLRLRQLSSSGRYGVAHELVSGAEELQWIDFKDQVRTVLARGSIDNAAMSHDLQHAAWSLRLPGNEQRVIVQRGRAPPSEPPDANELAAQAAPDVAGGQAAGSIQNAASPLAVVTGAQATTATQASNSIDPYGIEPPASRPAKKRKTRVESE